MRSGRYWDDRVEDLYRGTGSKINPNALPDPPHPTPPYSSGTGRTFLHDSIKRAIETGSAQTVEVEATTRGSDGFMHISGKSSTSPALTRMAMRLI